MTSCMNTATDALECDSLHTVQINPMFVASITNHALPSRMGARTETTEACDYECQRPSRITRSWVVRRRHSELPYRMPAPHSGSRRRSYDGRCYSEVPGGNGPTKPSNHTHVLDTPVVSAESSSGPCTLTTDVEGAKCRLQVPVDVFYRSQSLSELHLAGIELCQETMKGNNTHAIPDDNPLDVVVKDLSNFHVDG